MDASQDQTDVESFAARADCRRFRNYLRGKQRPRRVGGSGTVAHAHGARDDSLAGGLRA
jgi:catalase (peroxidase I)